MFHFSDYSKDSKFFDPVNEKMIGKMKDEVKGNIISEFVELNSKTYSRVTVDNEEIKKAKRVNKNVARNKRNQEYINVLFNNNIIRHKRKRIQSKLHRIETYDICKIYLSSFDDKRYIIDYYVWLLS